MNKLAPAPTPDWLYEYQKAMTNVRGLIARGQSESAVRLIDELAEKWGAAYRDKVGGDV